MLRSRQQAAAAIETITPLIGSWDEEEIRGGEAAVREHEQAMYEDLMFDAMASTRGDQHSIAFATRKIEWIRRQADSPTVPESRRSGGTRFIEAFEKLSNPESRRKVDNQVRQQFAADDEIVLSYAC